MASDLKVRISLFRFLQWTCIYRCAPHTKFFSLNNIFNRRRRIFISKEKKEKRKQLLEVKGFIKPSFPDEILPEGWRFYQEPKGLELGFMNTRNLSLLPFFYFLLCSFSVMFRKSDLVYRFGMVLGKGIKFRHGFYTLS